MRKSKVAVIMPVYNAESFLAEAIESVLNQSFQDFELIIINDGSTDKSESIVRSYNDKRIKFYSRRNKGLSITLNEGIRKSSALLIARMDADDICEVDRLAKQVACFDSDPNLGLVCSNVTYIDKFGDRLGVSLSYTLECNVTKSLLKGNTIFHPTVMFRKDIFYKTRLYDERIGAYFEDYLLWLQMIKFSKIRVIREPLLKYRLLENSLSRRKPKGIESIEEKISLNKGYYHDLYKDFEAVKDNEKSLKSKHPRLFSHKFHFAKSTLKDLLGLIRLR